MALTVADYVHKQLHLDSGKGDLNVCNMKVEKPLIAQEDGPQLFRVGGIYDANAQKINFDFYSVTSEGKKTITHATCGVAFETADTWLSAWDRSKFMVKSRIESLMQGVHNNGDTDVFKRGTAYKLFGGLINYGHKYRGMEEVILNNADLEATSSVAFQTNGTDDKFYCSPYRIDSVAHISGFIMLGNENANTSKEVYVSHGWENCRFARPLSMTKKYRSYVKMHRESAKVVIGDVYVFEEDTIVAVVEGLRVSFFISSIRITSDTGMKSRCSGLDNPPLPQINEKTSIEIATVLAVLTCYPHLLMVYSFTVYLVSSWILS